jgi:hypothetical protein
MNLDTISILIVLITVPTWFIVNRLEQIRIELLHFNRREEAKDSERQRQRERAGEALKDAVNKLSDPKFIEMDHNFGTGHGYRRAKRIVEAKTFDEIYRIVSGDDVPTELDGMDYREAVDEQKRTGSLFADPIPKRERIELGLTDRNAQPEQVASKAVRSEENTWELRN